MIRVRAFVVIEAETEAAADRLLGELRDGYDYGDDVESVVIVETEREVNV